MTFFKNRESEKLISVFFLFCASLVYLFFSLLINKDIFQPTNTNYYNYLLDSIFNGRVNLSSPNTYDLSSFNGKWFLYWGSSPVLFILPFFAFWGLAASDILYTLIAGILNIIFFYLLINEFIKYFKLKTPFVSKFILLFSFAFASPNFYLSLGGRIWHTYQVISILYLILFFLFYFKFLNNLKKFYFLILSVIFFNLAWFCRYTLIFNILFFIYPLILILKNKDKKLLLKTFLTISIIFSLFLLVFLSYNYLKFGRPLETGIQYVVGSARQTEILKKNKEFSINYFFYNLKYYFLNPLYATNHFPYLKIDKEGNGIFFVYPILFSLFFFKKKILRKFQLFLTISFFPIFLSLFTLMIYFATGWDQFGNRYFLDTLPIIFLLILFVLEYIPFSIQYILFILGAVINFLGAIAYYGN